LRPAFAERNQPQRGLGLELDTGEPDTGSRQLQGLSQTCRERRRGVMSEALAARRMIVRAIRL